MGYTMGNRSRLLGALEVSRINRRGITFVGGAAGLGLNVTKYGSRSWVFRYQVAGKRRDMGLGRYPDVSLATARELARAARVKLVQGVDPIEEVRERRSAKAAERLSSLTFREAADQYIDAHESGWKSTKHAQQWRNTLQTYANPKIGSLLVQDVTVAHVLSILEPIWRIRTETASRVRNRVESVLGWATTRGFRSGLNPARWRDHLDNLLPAPSKVAKKAHHRALPYAEAPTFMGTLKQQEGVGARALKFLILTATRSGEVRGATCSEIDEASATWPIPATRMKAGKEHRVPLSPSAMALFREQKDRALNAWVFPGMKDKPLSDMTLSAVLKRMGVNAVPHGFRSTFRDWSAEETHCANEVAEMALAHAVGDKVEAAYRRGDLFEKRRRLMEEWAQFLGAPAAGEPGAESGDVKDHLTLEEVVTT
jgi:integrase